MSLEDPNGITGAWSRRKFIQIGAAGAVMLNEGLLSPAEDAQGSMLDVPFDKRDPRIGMIGLGGRGTSLLGNLLAADAQIVAICDIVPE